MVRRELLVSVADDIHVALLFFEISLLYFFLTLLLLLFVLRPR